MDKTYSRIDWKNKPSTQTPLGATNLNKMDQAIDDIDSRVVVMNGRIDEMSKTPGGTTGDAELADIRVSYDGKSYPNAGTAVRSQVGDIKSSLVSLFETEYDCHNVIYPLYKGRMNNSGVPAISQAYGYTTSYFYARGGRIKIDDVNLVKMRVAKFSAPSAESFLSIKTDERDYTIDEECWYRVDVEYKDTVTPADESIFSHMSGYIVASTKRYVSSEAELIASANDTMVKEIVIGADIKVYQPVNFSGDKCIYGNGHEITGNRSILYLFYIPEGNTIIKDLKLVGAKDDVVYVGGDCKLVRCDISNSYENDGIGTHGDANLYVYDCKVHDNYDEGISTHDHSYCECYHSEFYKNGYVVGGNTESDVSFGGLHFGGSKMGVARNNHCHHNSKNGIGFITIDGNYSADAVCVAEGNICDHNVDSGIRFGGASNILCVNNMVVANNTHILFYKKDGYGNNGYVGKNSSEYNIWSGADEGLVFIN